jgi:hypothetical protein
MQTRGNLPIDAITGEPIDYGYAGPMFDRGMGGASAEYSLSLTPEEQKAINDSSNYITKEKAEEIAKKILSIDEKYKLVNASLYTTYINGNAVWSLSWQYNDETANASGNIYADIDAVKGEIKNFSMYGTEFDHQKDSKPIYTKDTARSVADNLIKQLYPERFSSLEYRDYVNNYYGPGDQVSGYNYMYYRKYNGILCQFDYINVYVDIYSGKVTNFSSNWTDISLPSSDGSLSLDDAHRILFDNAKFTLKYMKIYDYSKGMGVPSIKLAYVLDNFSGYMDSKSGTLLDYSGKPVKEFKAPEFTDIKGHPAENNIKLLAQLGVFQDMGDKFMPNGALLQKDFIKFLVCSLEPVYDYYGSASTDEYDKYYDRALQKKIITEAERKPNAPVTRQDAAKMFVKALGIGFVANLSGIYNLPFKDSKSISQSYKGYAAIASELKVVNPVGGYFYPAKQITRGEAAGMLVNFMKVNTNPAD